MRWLFSFEGQIGRRRYALASISVVLSQYLLIWLIFRASGQDLQPGWLFFISPLQTLIHLKPPSVGVFAVAIVHMLIASWALAALAFRRARSAAIGGWVSALVITPTLQLPIILFLCLGPVRNAAGNVLESYAGAGETLEWTQATQGVLAGLCVTLSAVILGALVFGSYGYGVFCVTPFIVGTVTAYIGNRKGDIGSDNTVGLVLIAAFLGGVLLVGVALEGIVCLIMAIPIALPVALLGGILGRSMALHGTRRRPTLMSFAALPIVFAAEAVLPPVADFDTCQTVEIDAPAETVWESVVHMNKIDEPIALPFRLGVAYPLSGEIVGEGIGATRLGVFSTGTAVERVTEWETNRKLAFVVTKDIPGMRELSPYEHVRAPHVIGYFRTTNTSFELQPLAGGRTKMIERTAHELRLDPVIYWLPLARWVVDLNNGRVLAHLKHQAEMRAS